MKVITVKVLYETYEKPILRYLYGLTGNYHLAEELTQETFFQVVKSFHLFRKESNVTTWLYKIARNVYLLRMRKKTNGEILMEDIELKAGYEGNPETIIETKEQNKLITYVLKQLPEKYKELILLRDWQGLSYQEIAIITARPISWVKINIYRGRQEFKEVYQEMEGNHG